MKKINIYIAKRKRDEHLKVCLHYLNEANKSMDYDVRVYIGYDDLFLCKLLYPDYDYIDVEWHNVRAKGLFNKSELLNTCIAKARTDWDWMSIVDLDMIYPPDFYKKIERSLEEGYDYIVAHGYHLDENTIDKFKEKCCPSFKEAYNLDKIPFEVGPSQITMNRKSFNLFMRLLGNKLYDENFLGWGGEDSLLSFMSRDLFRYGQIGKTELKGVWLHQYHKKIWEVDPNHHISYEKNNEWFKTRSRKLTQLISRLYGR